MLERTVRVVVAVLVVSFAAGPAGAAPANFNSLLKGDYAFMGTTTCLVSRGGFNADLTPFGPPALFPFLITFSVQGVRTFNGDGTGSVSARVLSVSHPFALPSPVVAPYTPSFNRGAGSSTDVEATFTYTVGPDSKVVIDNATFLGTILTGPGVGQTFTVTDFPQFVGYLSQDHKALTLAHEEPVIETQTFSGGDVQYRICPRARVLLKR